MAGTKRGVPVQWELAALGSTDFPANYRQRSHAIELKLEALIEINRDWIRLFPNKIPRFDRARLVYRKDPVWHDIPLVLSAGGSDCKSLVAYYLADLRERDGIEAARPFVSWRRGPKNGGNHLKFHVQVWLPSGGIVDPCRQIGM